MQRLDPNLKGVAFVLMLVLLGGSLYAFYSYSSSKRSLTEELEQAEFVVTEFDIYQSDQNNILARGNAVINTNRTSSEVDGVHLQELDLKVFNNSEYIASTVVPINNSLISNGIQFEIAIPIETSNPSKTTTDVLTNIMIGTEFDLDFTATIHYEIRGIHQQLEFKNKVLFRLEQPPLEFSLEYFDLLGSDQTIEFELFNPFSTSLGIEGTVDVVVQDTIVGSIEVGNIVLSSKWNRIRENFIPAIPIPELFELYFQYVNHPIKLATELTLTFDKLSFTSSPTLDLLGGGISVQFNSINIKQLNLNTSGIEMDLLADLMVTSALPIDLNLTSIEMTFQSENSHIGGLTWSTDNPVFLEVQQPILLENISLFVSINESDLVDLMDSNILSITNIRVSILIHSLIYSYSIADQLILLSDLAPVL